MLKLIINNIKSHLLPYALSASVTAFLTFYLVICFNTLLSITQSLRVAVSDNMSGHFVVVPQGQAGIEMIDTSAELKNTAIPEWKKLMDWLDAHDLVAAASPRITMNGNVRSRHNLVAVQIHGVDWTREALLLPGRTIEAGDEPSEDGNIAMYYRHADTLSADIDDPLGLVWFDSEGYRRFSPGVLRTRFEYDALSYYHEYAAAAFVPVNWLKNLMQSESGKTAINRIHIRLHNPEHAGKFKKEFTRKWGHLAAVLISAEDTSRLVRGIGMLTLVLALLVAGILIILALVSSAFAASLLLESRRVEIGVYQAIGVSQNRIAGLIAGEFFLASLAAALIGVVASFPVMNMISSTGIRATIAPLYLVFGRPLLTISSNPWTPVFTVLLLTITFMCTVGYAVIRLGKIQAVEVLRDI